MILCIRKSEPGLKDCINIVFILEALQSCGDAIMVQPLSKKLIDYMCYNHLNIYPDDKGGNHGNHALSFSNVERFLSDVQSSTNQKLNSAIFFNIKSEPCLKRALKSFRNEMHYLHSNSYHVVWCNTLLIKYIHAYLTEKQIVTANTI